MKKLLSILAIAGLMTACNNSADTSAAAAVDSPKTMVDTTVAAAAAADTSKAAVVDTAKKAVVADTTKKAEAAKK